MRWSYGKLAHGQGEAAATRASLEDWATALGLELDEPLRAILAETIRRGMLNCCRQFGKSTIIAMKAGYFAVNRPESTVLMLGPSARQSEELLQKTAGMLRRLGLPGTYGKTRLDLPNGSRILALPNQPETIRGYSPQLLVVDEAAYLDDEMWEAVFPMLNAAEGGGWLWPMSTPAQPAGFFYRLWTAGGDDWTRVRVTGPECARLSPAVMEEARRTMTRAEFARQYLCEFEQAATAAYEKPLVEGSLDVTLGEYFQAALPHPLPAAPPRARPDAYVGVDLGRSHDPSAIAVVEFMTEPTGTVHPETRAPLFRCSLAVRYLESPALETPYPEVVRRVVTLSEHARLRGRCTLVVDASGVGSPVVDLMKLTRGAKGAPIEPVVITSGREVGQSSGGTTVPKTALMDRLEHGLRMNKVRVAPGELTKELFRQLMLLEREVKPSGHVTYTPAPGVHDDLVLAVALAVWQAWTVHAKYLEHDGPVPIVGETGMLHETMAHPLLRGSGWPAGMALPGSGRTWWKG